MFRMQDILNQERSSSARIARRPCWRDMTWKRARSELDREDFAPGHAGMWRWHELLPVHDPETVITLGEGDTALLHVDQRWAQRPGLRPLRQR